ncbi:MAG: hypothetical protein EA361_00515 [Bacteroidetes bacterium]|nr:MAG: hypothetical protein EA361_00515 [Bacteroidota bacterium]
MINTIIEVRFRGYGFVFILAEEGLKNKEESRVIPKGTKSNLTQRFKVFKQDSGSKPNTNTVLIILSILQFL